MATEIFAQPNIASHLNTHFVMVIINASENAALAQKFAVTAIPTDLIIKPNGQLVHRRTGGIDAERFAKYLNFLQETIRAEKGQVSASPASPAPPAPVSMSLTNPAANPTSFPNPTPSSPTVVPTQAIAFPETIRDPFMQPAPPVAGAMPPPAAANPLRTAEMAAGPVMTSNPPQASVPVPSTAAPPVAAAVAPAPVSPVIMTSEPAPPKMTVEVPLALEGFCPVTLCAEERWVSGNPAYCTMYQGHIFRFATTEALGTFARSPANFIPIAMGEDIVLMVERNKRVNGNRKFGAWFQGRVFLFSSQETLDAFAARPEYYTEIALKYELARKEPSMPTLY
jgi:YHS domain-containing protein